MTRPGLAQTKPVVAALRRRAGGILWRLVPGLLVRRRLRVWPVLQRIDAGQARLGDDGVCTVSPRIPRDAFDGRDVSVETASELTAAVRRVAETGGRVHLPAHRIELREPLCVPGGVHLIGQGVVSELVFHDVPWGLRIVGSQAEPARVVSVQDLALHHGGRSVGVAGGVLICRAQDVVLDNVHVSSDAGIGVFVADGTRRVAIQNSVIRDCAGDGIGLLRDVMDVAIVGCAVKTNGQSGVLLCDWPLPPGVEVTAFDEQIRRMGCGVAFDPTDPGPCRIAVRRCEIRGNRKMGICTDGAGYMQVDDCCIAENQCEGITLDNGTWHAAVRRCVVVANGRRAGQREDELAVDFVADDDRLADGTSAVKLPGISMDNAAFCRVEGCTLAENYGDGVKFVRAAYRCVIAQNKIHANNRGGSEGHPHYGVRVGADSAQHPGQHDFPSSRNEICSNRISGAHECGVLLNEGTYGNRVVGNRITGVLKRAVEDRSRGANRVKA